LRCKGNAPPPGLLFPGLVPSHSFCFDIMNSRIVRGEAAARLLELLFLPFTGRVRKPKAERNDPNTTSRADALKAMLRDTEMTTLDRTTNQKSQVTGATFHEQR
jgi:hypothetical protein